MFVVCCLMFVDCCLLRDVRCMPFAVCAVVVGYFLLFDACCLLSVV